MYFRDILAKSKQSIITDKELLIKTKHSLAVVRVSVNSKIKMTAWNAKNWTKSFKNLAPELVEMKFPMDTYEERHREFAEMTIHSMFGKFYCPNCKSK